MKILIVEDEEMIRGESVTIWPIVVMETIEAADGQEALEKFSSYEGWPWFYWISRCPSSMVSKS